MMKSSKPFMWGVILKVSHAMDCCSFLPLGIQINALEIQIDSVINSVVPMTCMGLGA